MVSTARRFISGLENGEGFLAAALEEEQNAAIVVHALQDGFEILLAVNGATTSLSDDIPALHAGSGCGAQGSDFCHENSTTGFALDFHFLKKRWSGIAHGQARADGMLAAIRLRSWRRAGIFAWRAHGSSHEFIRLLAGLDIDTERAALSPDLEFHGLADFFTKNLALEVGGKAHGFAIDFGDDIPWDEIAALRWGSGLDASKDDALIDAGKELAKLAILFQTGYGNAQPGTAHMAFGHELVGDVFCCVDGNGKADAAIDAADEGVDAHDASINVAEGAAAVSGIDRSVGLDEFVVIAAEGECAAFGADNARGKGVGQLHGRSDGEGEFTHANSIAVAEGGHTKIRRVDFDHGDIASLVGTDE